MKIKESITEFLLDDNGPKLKSELELNEQLEFLKYDYESYSNAMLEMLRARELKSEKMRLYNSKLDKDYEVRFYFLSGDYTEQKSPHKTRYGQ